MMFITILLVATLNILTNHTMLNRKKSVSYCVIMFILHSTFVIICSLFFREVISNPTVYKYVFYLTAFLYIGYIYLVFSDSLPIKIFSMFSIWVFSTIILSISNMTFNIIGDHYITLYIANTIRIVLQLLLLGISYKWYGVTFKKTLKLVNVKTTYLMSCYMILALILLVNSFSWNNHILTNRNGVIEMILFILFIILGYFIVFLGISSFSKNILLKQNMNSIKKQSKINYMLANYDDLTGIATRQNIFNQISKAADEFKLSNVPFALIIFDIDRFKSVNDRYGHIIGDTAITLVAKIAANCLSQNDSIGRLGGDEFIIFSKGIHTTTDAEFLIRRIQNALKTPLVIGDHLIQIDISIGISFFPSDSQLVDELYEQADKAMYLAKKSTGTSFNFFQL